jgi:hypothetical protein
MEVREVGRLFLLLFSFTQREKNKNIEKISLSSMY